MMIIIVIIIMIIIINTFINMIVIHVLLQVVVGEEGGVEIECPLCHSQFSLADGTAGKWCPKDGLLTGIIGTLKGKSERTDALVRFKAKTRDCERIFRRINFVKSCIEYAIRIDIEVGERVRRCLCSVSLYFWRA